MIYLDYNASTPMDPDVQAAVAAELGSVGNAASTDHAVGARARARVEEARSEVAALIGADPDEIVFTSGATESDNIAVLGTLARRPGPLVVSAIEHPAVLEPARQSGRAVVAPVLASGLVDVAALGELVSAETALVSVMAVNNETGAVQPLGAIATLCAEHEVPLHIDAAQAGARLSLDVKKLGASLLSLSGHKMYGPQGVGALFVRRRPRAKVAPISWGGGHERGLRPGTLNVAGIVGLGVAAKLARERLRDDGDLARRLSTRLFEALAPVGVIRNVAADVAVPHTLSVRFPDVSARALLHAVNEEVAFSTGSACATIKNEPSHVLAALGLDARAIAESVRLSLGRFTTADEVDVAGALISAAAGQLRALAA